MCGIIGFIGKKEAAPILIEGLKRLEYRGYDSAGIAVLSAEKEIQIRKQTGKIVELEKIVDSQPVSGNIGIAHTRWATHGAATVTNAHPHTGETGKIAIVHNGIIENYATLKKHLENEGRKFKTETDSEVIAHLIERYFYDDENSDTENLSPLAKLEKAVSDTVKMLEGTFGIAVLCADIPDTIIGARKGSPLVLGISRDAMFIASDINAFVTYTRQVIYLDDNEIVTINRDTYQTKNFERAPVSKDVEEISWDVDEIGRAGYDHFMLKEICEQPVSVKNAFTGRLLHELATAKLGGLKMTNKDILNIDRILITACGTALHAGMVGKYIIEKLAGIPVEVDFASEFRYRNPIIRPNTVVFCISQSGETADTLAALREAKQKGATVMGICNVVGSTIARECDGGVYVHAGPEIGVASTKAFTSQVMVMILLAIYFGRVRGLSRDDASVLMNAIETLPEAIQLVLADREKIKKVADKYTETEHAFFMGRNDQFPVALEGALKLKEISYIDANGYPAAEMKHGPIALIDENHLTVALAPNSPLLEKMIANIQEIKARNGKIVTITDIKNQTIEKLSDDVIMIPEVHPALMPILMAIPLQLFAYYVAVGRGCDVDQPRNLAKSVTVE